MNTRKRWRWIVWVIAIGIFTVFVMIALGLAYFNLTPGGRKIRAEAIAHRTWLEIHQLAIATEQFQAHFKRWPVSLHELQTNAWIFYDGRLTDSWGREYRYTAPTGEISGMIETFGKDGDPVGDRGDGDASLKLPREGN